MNGRPAHEDVGRKFGRLTVLSVVPLPPKTKQRKIIVRCDCGSVKEVRLSHVRGGLTQSCGCLIIETITKHGHAHRRTKSADEYVIWLGMRHRCNTPQKAKHKNHAGRGIKVCARWDDFAAFLEDMGPRPSKAHSIERIDNDGDYEPGNCRWATVKEQAHNKRTNHLLTLDGETLPIAAWAARSGIHENTILYRVRYGWPIRDAIYKPSIKVGRSRSTPLEEAA